MVIGHFTNCHNAGEKGLESVAQIKLLVFNDFVLVLFMKHFNIPLILDK